MAFLIDFEIEPGVNVAPLQDDKTVVNLTLSIPKVIEKGYARVESFSSIGKDTLMALVTFRLDRGDSIWYKESKFHCPLDLSDSGKNPTKQIYEYLKSLDEFEAAIDIFE